MGYIWDKQTKKMDKKEIQSFSLSRLLEDHELRPGDLYYDGCLIASRVDSHCDIRSDLFRYPIRINALALVFCSKGSITLTSNLTHRQLSEHTLYVHFPGSILQVDPIEGVELYAVICEEEFIRRINVDLKLLSRLFLRLERQPLLQLDDEQWQEIMRSFDEISHERDLYRDDAYSIEILRSAIRMLIYKVSRIIDRYGMSPHGAGRPLPAQPAGGVFPTLHERADTALHARTFGRVLRFATQPDSEVSLDAHPADDRAHGLRVDR